uniref:Lysosome-associated membrane glycoprotein 2-like transmembrane domain-containing protein n=1 Tax=Plectus sambesii TaxID=2011161 RepID=A0A914UI92_9BILA
MMRLLLLSVVALVALSAGYTRAQETTTEAPPTTTTPPPYRNKWIVKDALTGTPCILFDANVTVSVKYTKFNSTSKSDFVNVDVPLDAEVDQILSSCGSIDTKKNVTAQKLYIKFYPVNFTTNATDPWTMTFYFTEDKKETNGKAFGLYKIELNAVYKDYPQFIDPDVPSETFESGTSFSGVVGASTNHSSQCSSGDLSLNENAKIHLNGFRAQAFGHSDDFLTSELCDHDVRTSDIVPIVVGACLAALVIIVLIAYLIGRARAKRQGYASV